MTEAARGPREGVLERSEDGRWRLRFERLLGHPPEKVWRALTEEEHLEAWFPTTIEGERRPGAPLDFRFRGGEYPSTHGELLAWEPPRVLEFSWGFTGEEGEEQPERTRFELEPAGTGCRLTMTTTYDNVGKSARDAAGWHLCLDLLEGELAGKARVEPPSDAWQPLNDRYAKRFPSEASTMGPPEPRTE